MKMKRHTSLALAALAFVTMGAQAQILLSETFSGGESTALVGTPTPDGNNWTGAMGEARQAPETDKREEPADESSRKPTVMQDGATAGIPFTAYHKFTFKPGRVYTLEAVLSPTNKADNQWLTVGFALTADNGDAVPHLDGGKTYGQTVLSGSGYRYGWAGPDTKDMSELTGPGLHHGSVKAILDTTDASDYTIELLNGEGDSIHGPKSIGKPAITQVFIGSSGTDGRFGRVTLSEDSPGPATPGSGGGSNAPPVVVMLGDSTTDGGMPTAVKKLLDQRIEPPTVRPSFINAGKGGDNATSALERLEKDVLAHKPDIVTVSFGLNDAGARKPGQYGESIRTIVKTLKAAGIEVVLMTSTPFNNERHSWGKQFEELGGLDEYMDREFCEKVRRIAEEESVPLCDLHAIFKAEIEKDAGLIDKLISTDGVHLTGAGYDMVAKQIVPVLHKLLDGDRADPSGKTGDSGP